MVASRWNRLRSRPLTLEDRNIRQFYLDTACQGLVSGGIGTFLAIFVVRLGASSFLVSLLTSLPAILMAPLAIPAGLFVERQRDLMKVTNWGRILHRGSFLLVALVPFLVRDHLAEAITLLWTLKSIPAAFINLSWTGIIAEIISPQRRPRVNGNRWALVSLVSALSVPGFSLILDRIVFPLNYQIVFFISFVGGVLSIYSFSRIILPSSVQDSIVEQARSASQPKATGTAIQRLRDYAASFVQAPTFVRYLVTTLVLRFGLNLPSALYSIYWIRHLDASDSWIGWQATAASLALIVGYFAWGRIAARKGHYLVLLTCTVGLSLYPLCTGLIPSQFWLPVVALLRGFFVTGINISFFDTLLHICPADRRPSFVALNTLCAQLALFLAPMAGSLLADLTDIRVVFFLASGILLLAAVLFRRFRVAQDKT